MANETATLASYVANLKYDDIPADVLERAKALTLDFLGSAVRARQDAESTPSPARDARNTLGSTPRVRPRFAATAALTHQPSPLC